MQRTAHECKQICRFLWEGCDQMWVELQPNSQLHSPVSPIGIRQGSGNSKPIVDLDMRQNKILRYSAARQSRNQIARSGMKFRVYAAIAHTLVT